MTSKSDIQTHIHSTLYAHMHINQWVRRRVTGVCIYFLVYVCLSLSPSSTPFVQVLSFTKIKSLEFVFEAANTCLCNCESRPCLWSLPLPAKVMSDALSLWLPLLRKSFIFYFFYLYTYIKLWFLTWLKRELSETNIPIINT